VKGCCEGFSLPPHECCESLLTLYFLHCLLLQDNLDKPFYVWGEDALLQWPGAEQPLIHERDQFMGRALAAAATGRNPNVPLYVADTVSWACRTGRLLTVADCSLS
jgi:hypothetical protein